MDKCIECGKPAGGSYWSDNGNHEIRVKLTKSRYGLLCQRHVSNAYARQMTKKKTTKRQDAKRQAIIDSGQLDMFDMGGGE